MNPNTRITTFVNLTPHTVSVILASGETLTIDPQPTPARVSQSHTVITRSDDGDQSGRTVEIAAPVYGEIVGLPAPAPTVAYICSVFVANAAAAIGRTDVLYPDSGPDAARKDGHIVAVRRLLAPVTPVDPHRDPEVQETLGRLHFTMECLGLREDNGDGEQPMSTRRDGAFLGYPSPSVWICRMGGSGTYWLVYWDYGYQCYVRDPMPESYLTKIAARIKAA